MPKRTKQPKPTNQSDFPQVKTCPHCGHDVFHVCKTWHGEERLFQRNVNSFSKEKVDFDEEEYHLIQCNSCKREFDSINELFLQ